MIPSFLTNLSKTTRTLPNNGGNYTVANSTQPFPQGMTNQPMFPTPDTPNLSNMPLLGSLGSSPVVQGQQTPPNQGSGGSVVVNPTVNPVVNPQPTQGTYTPEQYDALNALIAGKLGGAPMGSTGMEGGYSGATDSVNLRREMMRDRAQGTGLYSVPKDTYATVDQIMGIRAMADKHYSDLIGTASESEKTQAQLNKPTAYGIDADLSGLSTQNVNLLYKMSDDFNSHPIVKNFNIIQRSSAAADNIISDIKSRPNKKATAGDDMSLMYLFAKAQDPDSVVRESEYANVGEYFSTLPQNVQFKLSTIYKTQPDGKLTDIARDNIARGINTLYKTNKQQYDNLREDSVGMLKSAAGGRDVSKTFLRNYEEAYGGDSTGGTSGGTGVVKDFNW